MARLKQIKTQIRQKIYQNKTKNYKLITNHYWITFFYSNKGANISSLPLQKECFFWLRESPKRYRTKYLFLAQWKVLDHHWPSLFSLSSNPEQILAQAEQQEIQNQKLCEYLKATGQIQEIFHLVQHWESEGEQKVWKEIEWKLRNALEKIQRSIGFDWNFDALPKFFCLACKKILPRQELANSKFTRKVYTHLEKIIQNWEPKNEKKLETSF